MLITRLFSRGNSQPDEVEVNISKDYITTGEIPIYFALVSIYGGTMINHCEETVVMAQERKVGFVWSSEIEFSMIPRNIKEEIRKNVKLPNRGVIVKYSGLKDQAIMIDLNGKSHNLVSENKVGLTCDIEVLKTKENSIKELKEKRFVYEYVVNTIRMRKSDPYYYTINRIYDIAMSVYDNYELIKEVEAYHGKKVVLSEWIQDPNNILNFI